MCRHVVSHIRIRRVNVRVGLMVNLFDFPHDAILSYVY